jgi:NhaP-type Na+/H+ or K+/H+ antiporter
MGLALSTLQRSPLTAAIVYLAVGVLFGPTAFNPYQFNPLQQSELLESLTEVVVLLGAILAPTDSVLAGDVQRSHPVDHRRLRFTLACEAGLNDGSAFPFVMLGLGLLGAQ